MDNTVLVGILVVTVIVFMICNQSNKNSLKHIRKEFLTGMWSRDSDDTYIYIDPKTKNNGWNSGYIVRSDIVNEPIEVKITDLNKPNKVNIQFKGTDSIQSKNVAQIDISKGTLTITDRDDSPLILKKDNE